LTRRVKRQPVEEGRRGGAANDGEERSDERGPKHLFRFNAFSTTPCTKAFFEPPLKSQARRRLAATAAAALPTSATMSTTWRTSRRR